MSFKPSAKDVLTPITPNWTEKNPKIVNSPNQLSTVFVNLSKDRSLGPFISEAIISN